MELEERVRVLSQENARLLAAQADSLVLGALSEHLASLDQTDAIVRSGLERIGTMREVPVCALCEEVDGRLVVISSFITRGGDIDGRRLGASPGVVARVKNGPMLLVGKKCAAAGLPTDGALSGFTPSGVLLVPFPSRHVPGAVALFADDRPEREVVDVVDVLTRAAELLRVRLDTVALLFELKLLNAELDLKVADRTRALSVSEERLRLAIDAASLATWEWDVEAREVEWSGVAAMLGAEQELGPTIEDYVERVHPDDRAAVAVAFARARDTADPQRVEHRVPRADGTRWLELHARAAAARPGAPRRVAGVVLDVTDRRTLEDELYQSQKMESVGRLAGGIAHDFNNLLTTILGTSEMVLEALPPHHPLRADISAVREAGRRAATLTRQLLAFSRKQRLETRPESLADVVRGFTPMLSRLIGNDIVVRLELAEDLPPVLADRTQIEQILLNLAVNARDAMVGGGTLTFGVSESPPPAGMTGRAILLHVSDTGHGMSPEVAARAFDPFFTTKPAGKGTGLGLATVYGIVRQHLGNITVRTAPGKGTHFDIHLPVAVGVSESTGAEAPVEPVPHGKGEVVLVVDDEELVRTAVSRALAARGYEVLEAGSSAEALALIDREGDRIQLLLSDVIMPGGRGTELARTFTERHAGKPVLLMSGYLEPEDQGAPEGVPVLEKPLAPAQLARAVREALDG